MGLIKLTKDIQQWQMESDNHIGKYVKPDWRNENIYKT